jgi:hypothetical protein
MKNGRMLRGEREREEEGTTDFKERRKERRKVEMKEGRMGVKEGREERRQAGRKERRKTGRRLLQHCSDCVFCTPCSYC